MVVPVPAPSPWGFSGFPQKSPKIPEKSKTLFFQSLLTSSKALVKFITFQSTGQQIWIVPITVHTIHLKWKKTLNNSSKKYEPILDTAEPFGWCPGHAFFHSTLDLSVNPSEGVDQGQKVLELKNKINALWWIYRKVQSAMKKCMAWALSKRFNSI